MSSKRARTGVAESAGLARRARRTIAWLAPFGLIEPRRRRQAQRTADEARLRLRADRRERLRETEAEANSARALEFDYELAVDALIEDGVSELHVREGSMPRASLDFVAAQLREHLGEGPPLALHVGNFVGLSLAHLTATLRAHHPEALVVSVDPAVPHRGVQAPDRVALRLLDRFGLTANSLVISGFSRGKNWRDDGLVLPDEGPATAVAADVAQAAMAVDAACEYVLANLGRVLPARFDAVVLDGNHEAGYLREELAEAAALLREGGILVVDDVGDEFWTELGAVFDELADGGHGYVRVDDDGRVGILKRTLAS